MTRGIMFLNLSIVLGGLIISLSAIISILAGPKLSRKETNTLLQTFVCMTLLSGCNLAGQLMRGLPGPAFRSALYISNFGEFLFNAMLAFVVIRLLVYRLDSGEEGQIILGLAEILLAIQIALLIASQYTGLCYIIDENNLYTRTSGYALLYVVPFTMMAMGIYLLICYRRSVICQRKESFLGFLSNTCENTPILYRW